MRCAAFSPDSTQIATAGDAAIVKLWDARTGKALLDWSANVRPTHLVFSPDGTRILTGSIEQAVNVWDARTGKLLLDAKGMVGDESSVAFSPDGNRIVAGRMDWTARVIDARTGAVQLELKGRPPVANTIYMVTGVLCVAFSPDGTRIVTGGTIDSSTAEASVWDARTGAELLQLKGHTARVMSAAFSPDGTRIITGSEDGTVKVWDTRTGTPRLELDGIKGALCAAFSPDGTRIVTGGVGVPGEATVWDAWIGTPQLALKGLKGSVKSVAFSKDGTLIATGGGGTGSARPTVSGAKATVWDARTGAPLVELKGLTEPVNSVAFSPDGTRLVTAGGRIPNGGAGELKVWDATNGNCAARPDRKGFAWLFMGERRRERGVQPGRSAVRRGGWQRQPPERGESAGRRDGNGPGRNEREQEPGDERGVQQGRHADRHRQFRQDGDRLGRGDGDGSRRAERAHGRRELRGLQPRRQAGRHRQRRPDGKGLGRVDGDDPRRAERSHRCRHECVLQRRRDSDSHRRRWLDGRRGRGLRVAHPDRQGTAGRGGDCLPPAAHAAELVALPGRLPGARAAKDAFAAAFYLNLVPPDERKGVLEQAEADAFAALSKLAGEHQRAGKLDEALPLLIEILKVNKAKLGPNDPATIQTADTLGRVYHQMGQFEKGIPLLEDVLKDRKAKSGRTRRR